MRGGLVPGAIPWSASAKHQRLLGERRQVDQLTDLRGDHVHRVLLGAQPIARAEQGLTFRIFS